MRKRLALILGFLGCLFLMSHETGAVGQTGPVGQPGGDIEAALRRAVNKLNLKVEKLGPTSGPSAERWQENIDTGWTPADLPRQIPKARFAAQGEARHMMAWVIIGVSRMKTAAEALSQVQKVADHRRSRLAAGQKPFVGWTGEIKAVDFEGCKASRARLLDKSMEENDPPRLEWLYWVQGPLLVEFVVNSRAKEPDYGLEAAAYSLWKELQAEGFSCPGK
jgi:hypothetical protein